MFSPLKVFLVECGVFRWRWRLSLQFFARQVLRLECRQFGTGSVAVTVTCATTPLSLRTLNTTQKLSWNNVDTDREEKNTADLCSARGGAGPL